MKISPRRRLLAGMVVTIFLSALLLPLAAAAAEKTYTDAKNGFAVTLPSGWKKLKPEASDILFNAARTDQAAQWMLSVAVLKNKKEAAAMHESMTKQPATFGKLVKKELNKQFKSCSITSTKKKTLGSFTGAMAVYGCTTEGVQVTIQFFGFVRKTKQYSAVGVTTKAGYATFRADLETITKNITFTR